MSNAVQTPAIAHPMGPAKILALLAIVAFAAMQIVMVTKRLLRPMSVLLSY